MKAEIYESAPDYSEYEGMNIPGALHAQAGKRPDKVWLVQNEQRLTFKDFSDKTLGLAAALKKAGVKKGDHCALLIPNSINYLLLQFAVITLGAIVIPMDTRFRAHEIDFMLRFSGARYLFMVDHFLKADFVEILQEIRPNLSELKEVYVIGGTAPPDSRDFRDLLSYQASAAEIEEIRGNLPDPEDAATTLFTSGTTALPKGVMQSHRSRIWVGIRVAERMRITEDDAILNPLPFCHEFGGFTTPMLAIMGGCKMVIMETFNAEEAIRLIHEEKLSIINGVPTMFAYMLNSPGFKEYDYSHVRTGYMSGAACPLELVKRVQDEMHCNINVAYGLSECICHTLSEYEDSPERKATTCGKPVRDGEIKIVDDSRGTLPLGEVGEIAVRGKNMFLGYFQNREQTDKVLDAEGWLYTSDIGKLDKDGYLYLKAARET